MRSRRSAEDAPTRTRRTESPAPRSRAKPASEAPARSRRSAEEAPTRTRRAESPAPRSRAKPASEAPTRSRRTAEDKPSRSGAAKPRAARPETVAAKPMRGAARAPSRSAAPHKTPARPVPEAKVIRRPVGVPPKPVPQEEPSPRKRQVIAGPETKPARRSRAKEKATPDRLDQLVAAARASLEDDKAEDILVLDVTDRASFTDRMIIGTGLSERQIQAMANHLEDALEKVGLKLRRDAIQGSEDWVLIDCGDLVIHLFKPEARMTYALERMWGPESPPGGPVAEDGAALPEEPGEA